MRCYSPTPPTGGVGLLIINHEGVCVKYKYNVQNVQYTTNRGVRQLDIVQSRSKLE